MPFQDIDAAILSTPPLYLPQRDIGKWQRGSIACKQSIG
jgi:hypothetical protein